jgi:hypothetical protein
MLKIKNGWIVGPKNSMSVLNKWRPRVSGPGQTKYNKGRFKVMATYLQQLYNFEPTFIQWFCFEEGAKIL